MQRERQRERSKKAEEQMSRNMRRRRSCLAKRAIGITSVLQYLYSFFVYCLRATGERTEEVVVSRPGRGNQHLPRLILSSRQELLLHLPRPSRTASAHSVPWLISCFCAALCLQSAGACTWQLLPAQRRQAQTPSERCDQRPGVRSHLLDA